MGNLLSTTMRNRSVKNCEQEEFDGALPADLMLEILQRLHSKPLMRFLSVSKAWHSVILSPTFTKKHQIYHQDKFISFLHRYEDITKGVCMISKKTEDGHVIETHKDVPLPFAVEYSSLDSYFSKVYIVGCSNGLVCIRLCEATFFCRERTRFGLWNPATRQYKLLPIPNIVMHWLPDGHELSGSIDGFSYVPRIRDYKVVSILVFKDKQSANTRYLGRALVLNVAKKSWRELENYELPCTYFDQNVMITNGCLHLLVIRPEAVGQVSYYHQSLLSFDLDEEMFRHISMIPYRCKHINCDLNKCWRILTVFNENLAMFVSPTFRAYEYNDVPNNNDDEEEGDEELGNFFELWVCDVLTWSWSKKLSFGPLPRRSFPLGFWRDGKIVVRKNYHNQPYATSAAATSIDAYLYNPCNAEKSVLPCHEGKGCSLTFYSYVESLVQK